MVRIKNKCFHWSGFLALLFGIAWLFVTPVSMAAKNPDELLMASPPSKRYTEGNWLLIPQPLQTVKAELESSFRKQGLSGFQWHDDSAPLSAMESYWWQISLLNRPDIQQILSAQVKERAFPVFQQALKAGVISAEERGYEQAIQNLLKYDEEVLQSQPFFSQHIARWSFYREKGWFNKSDETSGILMDVSPMLARSPMTLVWFAGWHTVTSTRLEWASCMTGVTCFFAPHFVHPSETSTYLDPKLLAYLDSTAKKMQVLSDKESEQLMRGYLAAYDSHQIPVDKNPQRQSSTDSVSLEGSELPGDVYHSDTGDIYWNMVALPDGRVLISGDRTHQFVQENGQVRRISTPPELASTQDLKVDPSGMVWGYSYTRDMGAHFVSWNPKTNAIRNYPLPEGTRNSIRGYEWVTLPNQTIAFRNYSDFFTLDSGNQWVRSTWNSDLRSAVIQSLEHAMPRLDNPVRVIPQFGDSLFWQSDVDVYGIDPNTAKVANSIRIPSAKIAIGSHTGQWGLILNRLNKPSIVQVLDLKSGRSRFDVETNLVNNTSSLARSAHGRLLAISSQSSNSVLVLDMHNNKPLTVLQAPEGYAVHALAFSWKGDQLWMYAQHRDKSSMLVWDVPGFAIDPTQGEQIPSQLRCDFHHPYCN